MKKHDTHEATPAQTGPDTAEVAVSGETSTPEEQIIRLQEQLAAVEHLGAVASLGGPNWTSELFQASKPS